MNLENLEKVLANGPKYRLAQVRQTIFQQLIEDWQEAFFLPLTLREKLNCVCPLAISAKLSPSKDGNSTKARLVLNDGSQIETVLLRHQDGRNTVCLSSQVGCSLGCKFCATAKMGFVRNLTIFEIIEQALLFARILKKENKRISNIVFMGMGEPFLNYDNVLEAIKIFNDQKAFNIGARRISISTSGIVEGIRKLAEEKLQINLAVSLHAPNDNLRSKLMPINKKYNIETIIKAVEEYLLKTRRRVMFEYLLIKDINDSDLCAKELASLLKKPLYFVNLISYNPAGNNFKPSGSKRIKSFKDILIKAGMPFTQRYRFGQEIKAACGQLIVNH